MGCDVCGEAGLSVPPLTASLSISMESRALMADSLLDRWSGGRFRGCVSGSIFFFLDEEEPGSVEWRPKGRSGSVLDDGDSARALVLAEEFLAGAVFLAGDLVGEWCNLGEEG